VIVCAAWLEGAVVDGVVVAGGVVVVEGDVPGAICVAGGVAVVGAVLDFDDPPHPAITATAAGITTAATMTPRTRGRGASGG
jgi:hypothetical protein